MKPGSRQPTPAKLPAGSIGREGIPPQAPVPGRSGTQEPSHAGRGASQEDLRASEVRYRRLFESAKDGILILDAVTGAIVDVNPYLIELLGLSRGAFIGKQLWQLGFFKDITANQANLAALQGSGYIRYQDLPLRTAAGREVNVEFVSNVYQVEDRQVIQCNIRDITERKKAETALRASEQEFRSLAESMPQVVWIARPDGWNTYFNQQWMDYTGLTPQESHGHGWSITFHPDDRQRAWEAWRTALRHGSTYSVECRLRSAAGAYHWWLIRGVPVRDVAGKILKWFGTCTDIRAISQAEEKVAASEVRYRRLFETSKDGILILDAETGAVIDANPFLVGLLGFSHEQFLGKKVWELGFLKDIVANQANFAELQQKEYIRYEDMALETSTGRRIEVEFTSNLYLVNHQKVIQCDIRDISERKAAEEKQRASDVRYQRLFKSTKDGILILDAETGAVIDANPFLIGLLGFSHEQFLGKKVWELGFLKDIVANQANFAELQQKEYIRYEDMALETSTGRRIEVEFTSNLYLVNHQKVIQCDIRDISARREAKEAIRLLNLSLEQRVRERTEALRASEEKFRLVIEMIEEVTWLMEADFSKIHHVSPAYELIWGRSCASLYANPASLLETIHPDDVERVRGEFESYRQGLPVQHEYRIIRPDGEVRHIWDRAFPCRDADGQVRRYVGAAQDITARKQSEMDLRASEQRYRTLIQASPDGVIMTDMQGIILMANNAAVAMHGHAGEGDLVGRHLVDSFSPEERGNAQEHLANGLRGDMPAFESRIARPDGRTAEIELSGALIRDAKGEPTAYLALVRDITERRAVQRRTQEHAEALHLANEAILIGDPDGHIKFWNRGAERIFGWTMAEMVGKAIDAHLAMAGIGPSAEINAAIRSKSDWRGELQAFNRSGNPIVVAVSVTTLRDGAGRVTGWLSIGSDITEKKQLEEQFLRSQRLESIGMLATGIAHDFNNVLAPIGMAVPMLRPSVTTPAANRLLDTLERCGERGADLVKQILGFAHGIGRETRLVQIKHLLRDVAQVTETFPKSITLEARIPNDLWPVIANPTQIHQVLLNLCVNARDAMPQGGTLRLSAENCVIDQAGAAALQEMHAPLGARAGNWLVLHVADTGSGIPPETLPRIWLPFFSTKEVGKGTGLGLATVRGIVEAHHGFITLQTAVGKGAVFRIYLPADEALASHEIRDVASLAGRGHGELILLADDESLIRDMATQILVSAGYRVESAPDGAAAVSTFTPRSSEFALLITDTDMPRLDGPSLARIVRALNPTVKILAVSGLARRPHSDKSAEFADDFLTKPFRPQELLKRVAQLLAPPA